MQVGALKTQKQFDQSALHRHQPKGSLWACTFPWFFLLSWNLQDTQEAGCGPPPIRSLYWLTLVHLCINTILEQTKFEPKAGPTLGWLCVDPSWIFRKVLGGPVHARTFSPAVDKVIQMLLSNAPVFCHCPVT